MLLLSTVAIAPCGHSAAPQLDLALWNRAYQLKVQNLPLPSDSASSSSSSSAADTAGSQQPVAATTGDAAALPRSVLSDLDVPSSCSSGSTSSYGSDDRSGGYDTTDPVVAPLNACFYKQHQGPGGSSPVLSYWQKLPGDLRRLSNCYCYALDLRVNGFCTPGSRQLPVQGLTVRSRVHCSEQRSS